MEMVETVEQAVRTCPGNIHQMAAARSDCSGAARSRGRWLCDLPHGTSQPQSLHAPTRRWTILTNRRSYHHSRRTEILKAFNS